jgi:hypothetical protein
MYASHLSMRTWGLLYATTSNVPWATLLARTFEVDVRSCVRCGGRLEVRAVVTDLDITRKILDAIQATPRAPPSVESTLEYEPAFAWLAARPRVVRSGEAPVAVRRGYALVLAHVDGSQLGDPEVEHLDALARGSCPPRRR